MLINLAEEATGILPDANFPTSVARKSAVQQQSASYGVDTGTANAYAVTLTPTPTVAAGFAVSVKIANASTGASTLTINGGSPIAIKKNGNSTPIANGDFSAGQIVTFTSDGTVMQCIVPGAGAVASVTTTGTGGAASLSSSILNIPKYDGNGSPVLSRNRLGSSRAGNTVYQNTTGLPMIVLVYAAASTTATVTFVTDGSNPPTTTRATGLCPAGGLTLACFVASGNYYKVVGTGITISAWDEYTVLSGTFTDSSELSGSRAVSTVYRNTSGATMFLQVQSTAQTGNMSVISDSSATPTTVVWYNRPPASGTLTSFIPIPNNHYYEVTGITVASWREPTWSIACAKSANLTSSKACLVGFPNYTGKSTITLILCGTTSGRYTQGITCDPSLPPVGPTSMANENPGTGLCSVIGISQPFDLVYTQCDGVAYTITSWWEYQLG